MTHVAIIGPVHPFRGGIAHHTALLAQAFIKIGVRIRLWSFRRLYPRGLYPGSSDRDPSAVPLVFPAHYMLDSLSPLSAWRTAQAIHHWKAEVVVMPWWTTFLAPLTGWLMRWVRPAPVVLVHNVLPHEPRPWDTFLTRWALQPARAFLTQTLNEQQLVRALWPWATVAVHPHPAYDMFTAQRLDSAMARQQLGLPPDALVILFFGLVRPYKGLRVLMRAVAHLQARGLYPYLLVAGEFWEDMAGYRQLARDLGIISHTILHARYIPNEQVGLFFSAATLFAAPYTGGTQSGAIQVALSFGVPVVTSLASAPASPAVRYCTPNDPEALASALADWLTHPPVVVAPAATSASWDEMALTLLRLGGVMAYGY